jgi:streptogramin lyase
MAETFKCPSCAAPLEFEGKPMQKCPFCGSSVIVPSEMFYPPAGRHPNVDFASLTGRALKIAEIQREIQRGNKINAIKIFRETFGTGLKEAKDAVEAMERGESVDISGMQVQSLDLRANPETLEAVKKAGFAIGGSILGTVLLVTLIIVGMIVAIFYFTFSSVNRHLSTLPTPGSRGNVAVGTPTPVPDAEEVLKFGGEGTGAGKFKDNRHVAVDGKGFMYSADYSGGRIQVFDAEGKFVTQWIAEAGMNLYDMAADRKGNVYIANNKGVSMFEGETGKLLNKSDSYYIQGMARALDGKLIVSMGRGIAILGPDLKTVQEFKDASERASTTGNFREIAVDGNNNIYALDSHNGDICKFSADGKFLNRIPTGTTSPNGIAIAPSGRIFVSDVSSILVFDENGQKVKSFRATQAFGMAFNDAGELFVASRPYVIKYKLNF